MGLPGFPQVEKPRGQRNAFCWMFKSGIFMGLPGFLKLREKRRDREFEELLWMFKSEWGCPDLNRGRKYFRNLFYHPKLEA